MENTFKDKIVMITGATSGIGYSTAVAFSKENAKLVFTGRNTEKLEKMKTEFDKIGIEYLFLSGDITDEGFRIKLVKETKQKFGGLDILVNAAGVIASGTIENTTLDDFDKMMDINLRSVFRLIQITLPMIKERRGNIINISSVTGTRAFPGILSYCVSKSGLDQLTRVLALELAEYGVRVNGINPGVVQTNLHKNGGMGEEKYIQFLKHSETTHPLGRVGQPEEIANLIVFLSSDKAGWITGVNCNIDGGRHLTCAR
jgi:NAD(P)-dependent dehydrogenase (short-subunit alcohol dehydrogenase family)